MKKTTKQMVIGMTACAMVGALAVGGTMAYLTDHEETENVFTVGKVQVDLTEPDWPGNDSEEVKNLVPNQELPKNPQVTNTGNTDTIVYMVMNAPLIPKDRLASYDGDLISKELERFEVSPEYTSLFWFKDQADPETPPDLGAGKEDIYDGVDESEQYNHFSDQWVELTDKSMEDFMEQYSDNRLAGSDTPDLIMDSEHLRIFAYKTPLKPGEKTDALFDKIQLKNLIEFTKRDQHNKNGQRDAELGYENITVGGSIGLTACAIQADKVYGETADLTDSLTEENLAEIFKRFLSQSGQSGNLKWKDADEFNALDLSGNPRQD